MSALAAFVIPVGSLELRVPPGRNKVPGLLWGNLAVAAILESQGYADIARETLDKLQGWLELDRAQDLAFPGEVANRQGRRLIDGLEPGDAGLTWYAVRVANRQEKRAEVGLVEAGFVTYLPMFTYWRRLGHWRKVKSERPLLAGYLFVGCRNRQRSREAHDDDLNLIGEIEGVVGAVRFTADRQPQPVPFSGDCGIRRLLEEDLAGEFDRTLRGKRDRPEVKPGQAVNVLSGPFQGFAHTFEGLDDRGRVRTLMSLFGRKSPVTYDAGEVAEFSDEVE